MSCATPGLAVLPGDQDFTAVVNSSYTEAETRALAQLVELKAALREMANSNQFYTAVSKGVAQITGCQFMFISKRILNNDSGDAGAVEMPPLGEPGSCLMALSWYFDDGHGTAGDVKDVTYHAFSCPCAYMRHEKVFLVPSKLTEFLPNNPNTLPFPCDAYIGIPLFSQGKCIAHFGLMWSAEGNAQRKLGWGQIEMICHSIEDLVLRHVLRGTNFGNVDKEVAIIPHHDVSPNHQSLKTYARCLSHELRTPMHGVVGMLDVMYATVQEAVESNTDPRDKKLFETLKDNIELVQVSSRRAVEAADNVVQAYDLNMGNPETSILGPGTRLPIVESDRPVASPLQTRKRRPSWASHGPSTKHRTLPLSHKRQYNMTSAIEEVNRVTGVPLSEAKPEHVALVDTATPSSPSSPLLDPTIPASQNNTHTVIRELIEYVVKESLRIGKRYESAVLKEVEGGQIIDITSLAADGQQLKKVIEWTVDASVPDVIGSTLFSYFTTVHNNTNR